MAAVDRDVIVVGAGLAGLAAATKLEAEGLDVLVLEAQQRVGGRIHSMRQLGSGEAGGTYIGAGYERVIAAASRHGVPLVDVTPVLQFFREQDLVLGTSDHSPDRLAGGPGEPVPGRGQGAVAVELSPHFDGARQPARLSVRVARRPIRGSRRLGAHVASRARA